MVILSINAASSCNLVLRLDGANGKEEMPFLSEYAILQYKVMRGKRMSNGDDDHDDNGCSVDGRGCNNAQYAV